MLQKLIAFSILTFSVMGFAQENIKNESRDPAFIVRSVLHSYYGSDNMNHYKAYGVKVIGEDGAFYPLASGSMSSTGSVCSALGMQSTSDWNGYSEFEKGAKFVTTIYGEVKTYKKSMKKKHLRVDMVACVR